MTGTSLAELTARLPEGHTAVTYAGRSYGVTKTTTAGGRSLRVYAEELGGRDVISANLYLTTHGAELRPCEMPATKVLAFLEGWVAAPRRSRGGVHDAPPDRPL